MNIITPRTYKKLYRNIKTNGVRAEPRGKLTKEIINANLILRNPIDRIVPDRERKINIAFGIAEFYAFIFGVDDIEFFTKFISTYGKFSSDGKKLDGAYGGRMNIPVPLKLRSMDFNDQLDTSDIRNQLYAVVQKLGYDSDDRQAVISIYEGLDTFGGSGTNTPCTLTLQFLVRGIKLHMITNMRSNDIYRGLPYDLFVFTMLQELVARAGGWELGNYYHNAGSLHYYLEDEHKLERMNSKRDWPHLMEPMPSGVFSQEALRFFREGMDIAACKGVDFSEWYNRFIAHVSKASDYTLETYEAISYYKNLLATVSAFIHRKYDHTYALDAYGEINDKSLRRTIFPWLNARIFSGKYKMEGPVGSYVE